MGGRRKGKKAAKDEIELPNSIQEHMNDVFHTILESKRQEMLVHAEETSKMLTDAYERMIAAIPPEALAMTLEEFNAMAKEVDSIEKEKEIPPPNAKLVRESVQIMSTVGNRLIMSAPRKRSRKMEAAGPSSVSSDTSEKPASLRPTKLHVISSAHRKHSPRVARISRKADITPITHIGRPTRGTAQSRSASSSKQFTPKFDPSMPITPAQGLRPCNEAESFVMMSVTGSPLTVRRRRVGRQVLQTPGIVVPVSGGKCVLLEPGTNLNNLNISPRLTQCLSRMQGMLKSVVSK